LKGFLPTLAMARVASGMIHGEGLSSQAAGIMVTATALAAVLGHNHSPYLRFRGGKGVATTLGASLAIYPDLTIPVLAAGGIWAALAITTRRSSVASVSAGLTYPLLTWGFLHWRGRSPADAWPFPAFALAAAMLILWRHRSNLRRLLRGTEPTFDDPSPVPAGSAPEADDP
ncbi:MAG: glycerol-3-phosphate acyltransferase, partial [Planctomycetota bacterium]